MSSWFSFKSLVAGNPKVWLMHLFYAPWLNSSPLQCFWEPWKKSVVYCCRILTSQKLLQKVKWVPVSFKEKGGKPEDYLSQQYRQLHFFLLSWDKQGRLKWSLNVGQLSDGLQLYFLHVLQFTFSFFLCMCVL